MNPYNNQSRPNRRKTSSGYQGDNKKSSFLSILLFYVLPFIVVNGLIFFLVTAEPKGEITISESSDYMTTTMELKIKSLLPIKTIEFTLDGAPIEAVKSGSKTYTATLKNNGGLKVMLTGYNKMKTILSADVNVLDDNPPAIKDKLFKGGVLSFRLEDTQSGVDFSSVTACDEDTPEILPLSIDRNTGLVKFEIKKYNLTIKAKDKTGNELHVTFTPKGENMEDTELGDQETD